MLVNPSKQSKRVESFQSCSSFIETDEEKNNNPKTMENSILYSTVLKAKQIKGFYNVVLHYSKC